MPPAATTAAQSLERTTGTGGLGSHGDETGDLPVAVGDFSLQLQLTSAQNDTTTSMPAAVAVEVEGKEGQGQGMVDPRGCGEAV